MVSLEDNFTNIEYRKAKIVRLVTLDKQIQFIYKGNQINKEAADAITMQYLKEKKDRGK